MAKFSAKVMVVWRDQFGNHHDRLLNVEVEAKNREDAAQLAYAEGEKWLTMTDEPGGCEIRSLVEGGPQ